MNHLAPYQIVKNTIESLEKKKMMGSKNDTSCFDSCVSFLFPCFTTYEIDADPDTEYDPDTNMVVHVIHREQKSQ